MQIEAGQGALHALRILIQDRRMDSCFPSTVQLEGLFI